jgi:hypothetical protein
MELARTHARPLFEAAIANARSGKFEDSEKAFLSAKAVYGGMSYCCNVETLFTDEFAGWRAWVEKARAQWEAEAGARAAAWEAGALMRATAEVAQLKAEIARVEQEEAAREAAAMAEAARASAEKKAKKARDAEVAKAEKEAAALRKKLEAMKELMAMKADGSRPTSASRSRRTSASLPTPPTPLRAASPVDFGDEASLDALKSVAFRAQDFMTKARFRKLMADRGFPLEADQHVCHIIAESNGGANHIDNFFVAAGSLNQSLGNRNDAYLAGVAGLEQVRKAVAVSRTTGYTGPGADELIAMAKAARA